ncbi:hypothetical protein [Streptomyces variabilis]
MTPTITFLTIGALTLIASFALISRTSHKTTSARLIAATSCFLIANTTGGHTSGSILSAAALALALWHWWNGGGGDGTKRRLRNWRRRFEGVRRTAPVTAS